MFSHKQDNNVRLTYRRLCSLTFPLGSFSLNITHCNQNEAVGDDAFLPSATTLLSVDVLVWLHLRFSQPCTSSAFIELICSIGCLLDYSDTTHSWVWWLTSIYHTFAIIAFMPVVLWFFFSLHLRLKKKKKSPAKFILFIVAQCFGPTSQGHKETTNENIYERGHSWSHLPSQKQTNKHCPNARQMIITFLTPARLSGLPNGFKWEKQKDEELRTRGCCLIYLFIFLISSAES